jgi:hypothetical protein
MNGNEYSTHDLFYKMEFTADKSSERVVLRTKLQ